MFEDWINGDVKSVLLVEPNFPIPSKSRNHKNFLPIGLLKIASLLRNKYIDVELVRHGLMILIKMMFVWMISKKVI